MSRKKTKNKTMTKSNSGRASSKKKSRGGNFLPALCSVFGTLILLTVIAACVPLTVPRLLGYELFHVVSGSMEPTIPVGSVIYVRAEDPGLVDEGSIIAFQKNGEAVTHRVVDNHRVEREFITKGDANEADDFEPVPYDALVGVVVRHVPEIGRLMALLAGAVGKVYLLLLALCGVMFHMLGSRLRESRRRDEQRSAVPAPSMAAVPSVPAAATADLTAESNERTPPKKGKSAGLPTDPGREKRRRHTRFILMVLAFSVFFVSASTVIVLRRQYQAARELYADTAVRFTVESEPVSIEIPDSYFMVEEIQVKRLPELAPIQVDFDALQRVNPDVVGWIYCPGTVINYPVLHGETNDSYLHTTYDGKENASGSIFVEESNRKGFIDCNTIIYGHHMADRSMFATLDSWQQQGYFEDHPYLWLLTPQQDYKIALYGAATISAYDALYTVYPERTDAFAGWLDRSREASAVTAPVPEEAGSHYVMLSTCAYVFDNARSVLFGLLQPLSSAGGRALEQGVS